MCAPKKMHKFILRSLCDYATIPLDALKAAARRDEQHQKVDFGKIHFKLFLNFQVKTVAF